MRSKILSVACMIVMLIFAAAPSVTVTAASTGTITSLTISDSGVFEIIGYYDDTDWTASALLLFKGTELSSDISSEDIMYINQEPLGNNNTFYYRFKVDERFSEQPYVLAINGGELISVTGTVPRILDVIDVANNALRVGDDFYDIGHVMYTPNNIADSIEYGGNVIYYKIGDMWFDVLDENATSAAYLVSSNATPEEEVSQWYMRKYHHF